MVKIVIFISSPGDVGQERSIAERVAERLTQEFQGRLEFIPYRWEFDPLDATIDYQTQIDKALGASDLAVFIVWSKIGSRLDPNKFSRPDGTAYQSGTEFEYARAKEMRNGRGRPEILFYRRTDNGSLQIDDKVLEQAQLLIAFLKQEFWNADDSWKGSIHHFVKPEQFEDLLEKHLRAIATRRLGQAEGIRTWKESPYRGLRVFEFEDAGIYCGRTAIVADVVSHLKDRARDGLPFLMIQGMSGSGKSSLVRAGVLPHISVPRTIERVSVWRRAVFRPSDNPAGPLASFADALLGPTALPEISKSATELHELIRTPASLAKTVENAVARATLAQRSKDPTTDPEASARLIIVIDQFEELFSESISKDERNSLVLAVVALLGCGGVWGIGTMRADFAEATSTLPETFRDYLRGVGRYTLGGPRRSEIAEIIRRPARQNGYEFEQEGPDGGLDDRLLLDSAEDPRILPLLEFTLDELCKGARDDGVLKFKDYAALGGITEALGKRAESEFSKLSAKAQDSLPFLLAQLIHIEPRDVRVLARSSIPRKDIAGNAGALELADAFVNAWLLVADTGSDGAPTIGFAHEALTRAWPRITDWIRENMRVLRQRAAISAAAQRWSEHERKGRYLAEGQLLKEGRELANTNGQFLPAFEKDFVKKSTRRLWAQRSLRAAQLSLASVSVAALTIEFDAVSNYSRAILELAKVEASPRIPPLSASANANLQENIKHLSSHLSGRFSTGKARADGSLVPWLAAQETVALADRGTAASPDGAWLRQFMTDQRNKTCDCWVEASGNTEHRVATAWVMDSLATVRQPATNKEIESVLKGQSPTGWWAMFPSLDDPRNASVSATAWNLHALWHHLSENLVNDQQRGHVCSSVARGMTWLMDAPSRRGSSRWAEYPPGQTYQTHLEYLAPSAFVIHVLNEYQPNPALLAAWLDELPYASPELGVYDWAKGHVKLPEGKMQLDEVRHYQYPWMLMTTVDAYPYGNAMQRARATVWLERALREPITVSDQCNVDRAPRVPLTAEHASLRVSMAENGTVGTQKTTRLTLTISTKPGKAAGRFGFTEPLPRNYIVAEPPALKNDCGGTPTADPRSASVHLAGGEIPVGKPSCELSVDIATTEPINAMCVPSQEDWTMSEILISMRYLDDRMKGNGATPVANPCLAGGVMASVR